MEITITNDQSNDDKVEFPVPAAQRPKLKGFDFYHRTLGAPKFVVAPMVDASELAWRLLSRRHGAELCYTPMYHSTCFVKDPKYRKDALQSCPEDRPLILQFCGNDPKILLEAALLAQDHCDAIDINLGCPQQIAKRGHYGAFLQDEWDLLEEIVSTLHKNLSVPVTCKIRVFEDLDKSIKYAQMLEKAGCQLLTVHGRNREQRGPMTGLADWNYIKIVRANVKIPVFANGNIQSVEDVHRCLETTGANGVMTAEGNLYNPAIFENTLATSWAMAYEYLQLAKEYPTPRSYIRGHLFKIFHHLMNLTSNNDLREQMAISHTVEDFRSVVSVLEAKYQPFHEGHQPWTEELEHFNQQLRNDTANLYLPPWVCQPYVRMAPEKHIEKLEAAVKEANQPDAVKRQFYDDDGNEISRKKMKKLRRIARRPRHGDAISRPVVYCQNAECTNTMGIKCDFQLCRICCRDKCYLQNFDCVGHKCLIKSRREKAIYFEQLEAAKTDAAEECGSKDEMNC